TSISQYAYVLVDQNTAQTLAVGSLSSILVGTLVRTTQTAYLTGNVNYRDRNIVGLPTSVIIYQGPPSDNIVVAQSSIDYDEEAYPILSYGNAGGWTDPQTSYRGNATSARRWLNTTNAYIQTHL